jgi:hypothetical protein
MSISNLLVCPNHYNICANTVKAGAIGFRYSLEGGSALSSLTGYNVVGNFFINYGTPASDTINYAAPSPDFNITTGVYTIPVSGLWHLCAGTFYNALAALSTDTSILVGIGPIGDTSTPYSTAMTYAIAANLQNWSIQTECDVYLPSGTQIQAYTQQASGQTQTVPASRYNFFSGYLVGDSVASPE